MPSWLLPPTGWRRTSPATASGPVIASLCGCRIRPGGGRKLSGSRFIVRPSALALLRLMTSLNVVGCWKSGSQWTRNESEQSLALDVTPASWPIGMGHDFLGTYDLFADALLLFEHGVHDRVVETVRCSGLDDPQLPRLLPKAALAKLREEVEMARGLCPPLDPQANRAGHLTPIYVGSALGGLRGKADR
jgi:hypothetical protein